MPNSCFYFPTREQDIFECIWHLHNTPSSQVIILIFRSLWSGKASWTDNIQAKTFSLMAKTWFGVQYHKANNSQAISENLNLK